jgi:hypothetical protein
MAATVQQTKALDLTTVADPLQFRRAVSLTDGSTAGKADKVFHDRRTLAASATEDLDLAGVLLDAFGTAITFVRVKGLFVSAAAANTNNVVIGAAASNPWATLLSATGTLTLRPGASVGVMAGEADATTYAVTAGTGDLLKVANSGAGSTVTYDIVIVGASA